MSIRAVIFDLGGVLVRTEERAPRQQLAARLGMTYEQLSSLVFDSPSARLAMQGKIAPEAHWETVRAALALSPQELSVVRSDFWAGDVLDSGLVDTLRALRPRYKTALLSNAWGDLRQALASEWKIADVFDELVISAEVGLLKPAPRIYQLALERLGVAPQEAVFMDDFTENVAGARAVGMHAIHFRDSGQARADLEAVLDGR